MPFMLILASLSAVPAFAQEDPLGGENVFIVECGYVKSLKDDPILLFDQPGASHRHDFFGNPRTNAASRTGELVDATASLASATQSGTIATFTTTAPVGSFFTVGTSVRV